jgi:dTMP kinase
MATRQPQNGLFITFEGADASGKTTQAKIAAMYLNALLTREPGGTAIGVAIRALCLDGEYDPAPETELILMAADRTEHVKKVMLPAILSGQHVVCDRYTNSTLAYQGAGRGIDEKLLLSITTLATCGLVPDAVVVINVSEEVAKARQLGRAKADRMDLAGDAFQNRVRQSYIDQALRDPSIIIVDGNGTIDEVAASVRKELHERFSNIVFIPKH